MPQLVITTNESSGTGGVPTGSGTLFIGAAFDAGPPGTGAYAECRSMADVISKFGPRSSTVPAGYDALNLFFEEAQSAAVAYVTRVTDTTATKASLTLNDGQGAPKPTVVVTAQTAGTGGNNIEVQVSSSTSTTFTANTTSSSTSLASVSSFANIGVGTPISGTGIPTGTYISSINTGGGTAVMSQSATASGTGVTITPSQDTIEIVVFDNTGDQIAEEVHGPYYTTAQLFADTSSTWVTFTQSSGSGYTQNLPAALTGSELTGGADADDLTDATHVASLANFPASLGPGTVILPGKTSTTVWNGLLAHAADNNRFAVLDMADNASSEGVESAAAALTSSNGYTAENSQYGMFIQGSCIIPGVVPNTTRTVAGSAAVAALCAEVAQGASQAVAPCGTKWPLNYVQGFTEYFGPTPASSTTVGSFQQSDVNAMDTAGVNCFAVFGGALCLFGFRTPVSPEVDGIYDQATASRERMQLVSDCQAAMAPFLFDPIDQATIDQLNTVLTGVCGTHETNGALLAFLVNTASPVNTSATAEAAQLNAQISAVIPRYADTVNTAITVIPVTVGLPAQNNS